jgi:hypothetical protein
MGVQSYSTGVAGSDGMHTRLAPRQHSSSCLKRLTHSCLLILLPAQVHC